MELTAFAAWLNSFFAAFDYAVLSFWHTVAEACGDVLTPLMKLITLIGEKGILMFLLALVLVLFPKTRQIGVCVFGAVCCGALLTNVILKDLIARPRPMTDLFSDFYTWWVAVGAPAEEGFSFPSGHTTAAMAGMTALLLSHRRPWVFWTAFAYVSLIGISRNYLMAHYPTDVLMGVLVGALSAVIAYGIAKAIFLFLEGNREKRFCAFCLEFDVRRLFRGRVTGKD